MSFASLKKKRKSNFDKLKSQLETISAKGGNTEEEYWKPVLMLIAVSTSMMWIMMGNTRNSEVYKIITGSAAFLMWSKLIGFIQNTYKQFSIYVGSVLYICHIFLNGNVYKYAPVAL